LKSWSNNIKELKEREYLNNLGLLHDATGHSDSQTDSIFLGGSIDPTAT